MSIFNWDLSDVTSVMSNKSDTWETMSTINRYAIPSRYGKQLASFFKLDINDGPWLAGGSVRRSMNNMSIGQADWDIFFKDQRQFDLAKARIQKEANTNVLYDGINASTYSHNGHKIQLIKRKYYDNCVELINDFDLTICQYVTDGIETITGPNTLADTKHNIIRLNIPLTERPGIMGRITKYMVYGFKPCPELLDEIETYKGVLDYDTTNSEYEF